MVERLIVGETIIPELLERPEVIAYTLQRMKNELGRVIVDKMYAEKGNHFLLQMTPREEFRGFPNGHFGYEKRLELEITSTPIRVHKEISEYNIVQSDLAPIPHFRYFPMDWVCGKCGCINDGLTNPRMCPHCAAPRNAKIAQAEAMAYSSHAGRWNGIRKWYEGNPNSLGS